MSEERPERDVDPQAHAQLEALAQAGRSAEAEAERAADARTQEIRQNRLRYAARTPWKPVGFIALLLYPFMVGGVWLWWIRDHQPWWLPPLLLLGWPLLFFLRHRAIGKAAEAELEWAQNLPWPVRGYLPWIALERRHILVRFEGEPDLDRVEPALRGAIDGVLDVRKARVKRRGEDAVAIEIPPDLKAEGSEHERRVARFGNAKAFHAMTEALEVVHRVTPVAELRCTNLDGWL